MAKTADEKPAAPETKVVAEYWSKPGRFKLGDLVQFNPFTPGMNNWGKFPDQPGKIRKANDDEEYQLFRGHFKTSDPALIRDLDERCDDRSPRYNPQLYCASKTEVPV